MQSKRAVGVGDRQNVMIVLRRAKYYVMATVIGIPMFLTAASGMAAEQAMTGNELLALCTDAAGRPVARESCSNYVRGVIDGLATVNRIAGVAPHCMPPSVGLEAVVAAYVSESRRYPEVLHVPASDLIAGMLIKFYPCSGA